MCLLLLTPRLARRGADFGTFYRGFFVSWSRAARRFASSRAAPFQLLRRPRTKKQTEFASSNWKLRKQLDTMKIVAERIARYPAALSRHTEVHEEYHFGRAVLLSANRCRRSNVVFEQIAAANAGIACRAQDVEAGPAPMTRPRLSLLSPAHNSARYLPRLLRSAAALTEPPDEGWVFDDCSGDGAGMVPSHTVTAGAHSAWQ
jgi:hypothetical protein